MRALFIDGPKDGEILDLYDDRDLIAAVQLEPSLAVEEQDALIGVRTKRIYYRSMKLGIFGRQARGPVYVLEDPETPSYIREREVQDALARHLLSPLGQDLRGWHAHQ